MGTTRTGDWSALRSFAFDHRSQLEEMDGYTPEKGAAFKELCLEAALQVQAGQGGIRHPVRRPDRAGGAAPGQRHGPLDRAAGRIARRAPRRFRARAGRRIWGACANGRAKTWSSCWSSATLKTTTRRAKCRSRGSSGCSPRRGATGWNSCWTVIPSRVGPVDDWTTARLIRSVYAAGIYPDWWKLEPFRDRGRLGQCGIRDRGQRSALRRGIACWAGRAEEALAESFALAARQPLVKGFAVGRTIFADAARAWDDRRE